MTKQFEATLMGLYRIDSDCVMSEFFSPIYIHIFFFL